MSGALPAIDASAAGDPKLTVAQSAAIVWIAGIAPLANVLIPVLLPALEQKLHLAPHELSLAASANLVGGGLTALTAPLWLSKLSSRKSILIALVLTVFANAAASFATTREALLPIMLCAGAGTGMALCGGIPLVRRSTKPARLMSAIQVWQLLVGSVALSGAGWLLSVAGVRELLWVVAAASLITLPVASSLPDGGSAQGHSLPRLKDLRPGAWALAGIFVYFASISTFTNYAGKLGVQHGLTLAFAGWAIAIGNLGALPGSLIAALSNGTARHRLFLIAATIVECVALACLMFAHTTIVFAAAFFVVQLCVTVIVPIQVALLIEQDSNGRSIQAMGAMQGVGQALGPLSVAFALTAAGVDKVYYCAMLYVAVGAILILWPTFGARARRD